MRLTDYVIIGLVAVIALLIIFDKDPQQDTTQWKNAVASAEAKISKLTEENQALLNEREVINTKAHVKEDSLKTLYITKSKEVERLKKSPKVVYVRDTVPEIDTLLTAYEIRDSIQTGRILNLEQTNRDLNLNMDRVIDNCTERLKSENERYEAQVKLTEATMRENKKLRFQNKLLKVAIPVVFVGSLFLGSKL